MRQSSKDGRKGGIDRIMTEISTYAGSGKFGSANGERLLSTFRDPVGLLARSDGTLIVSDERNHLLRSITGTTVSIYAGVISEKDTGGVPAGGMLDGATGEALFREPSGLAEDAAGSIYVADAGNNAIRKIDPDGSVTTIAGCGTIGDRDGIGPVATFHHPKDVAVAADGSVYVADTLNHRIRCISPSGTVYTLNASSSRTVEGYPGMALPAGDYLDGDLARAKFNEPSGLAIDAKGNLYVSDSGNQRVRYIDFGTGKVTTVAGGGPLNAASAYEAGELYAQGGYADGDALQARFHFPAGIAVTVEGGLLIADSMNHSIRYMMDGKVITVAGHPPRRSGEAARTGADRLTLFRKPMAVAVAPDGGIYIADAYNNKVRRMELYQLPAYMPALTDRIDKHVLHKSGFDAPPGKNKSKSRTKANDRIQVPVQGIAEALGCKVDIQDDIRVVRFTKGGTSIELCVEGPGIRRKLGKNMTDTGIPRGVSPSLKKERTFAPVRLFAEEIGLELQWEQKSSLRKELQP